MMIWGALCSIVVTVCGIVWYEWPKFRPGQKREQAAFLALLILGAVLAGLLLFFPGLPGPTQLIDAAFQPLGTFLEKSS